jgi:hypothetical protein
MAHGSVRLTVTLLAVAPLGTRAEPGMAHDVPATVTALTYVKPEGQRLRLLIRVPLESMRDIQWPVSGPGYLQIERAGPLLHDAARQWIAAYLELYENGARLGEARLVAARVSLPSDRSFESYDRALVLALGPPLEAATELMWNQAMLDALFEYEIRSDRSRFSIRPALAHLGLRTTTVLRFLPPGGTERVFRYTGDPGLVRLDPGWHHAALQFVRLGFAHILGGADHLLFVVCLVIPVRRIRPLIAIVTSFTVAHSITLIASAMGLVPRALWFPPLVETLIALSIVYMAFENIVGVRLERRWLVAFGFGLVHGFGFSFALRESLQFAGSHLTTALLAFNLGVEAGQLLILAVALPALSWVFKRVVAERLGTIILSALVAHTAWHWMTERGSALRQYRYQWPALDAGFAVGAMRAALVALVLVGVARALYIAVGRWVRGEPGHERLTVP